MQSSSKSQTSGSHAVAEFYQQRVEQCSRLESRLVRVDRAASYVRAAVFLCSMALFAAGYAHPASRPLWLSLGSVAFVLFVTAVGYHDHALRNLSRTRLLRKINNEQRSRLDRDWGRIPVTHVDVPMQHAQVARDLDLFQRGSLFHLLCTANTPLGIQRLRDWLLSPAEPEGIVERQSAVQELAPERYLREERLLRGRQLAGSLTGPDTFLQWAEGAPWLARRPVLRWLSIVLPCIAVVAVGLALSGAVAPQVGGMTATVAVLVNIGISVFYTGTIHDIFNRITTRSGELGHYRALFDLVEKMPRSGRLLSRIHRDVNENHQGALLQLKRLARVMWLANFRRDALFGIPYIILQILLLWDFHVLALVERWQRRVGRDARQWFEALADLEAVSSLAGLAADNPTWAFPSVQRGATALEGHALGHPLLADANRVANDVTVGPRGTVLLVTGSNMSGKSTLLRALGVNAVLAQAGAPVCARQLSMPPLTVATSMRIDDSLVTGVSFYMAELKRLKQIVDQAAESADGSRRVLFYLLDEVLQGTNSVERHIAVGRVIAHLVSRQTLGAVSTHDLELAKTDELARACRPVHFRESFVQDDGVRRMTFDYKMRPGLATTTNALVLLEMVGLLPHGGGADGRSND